MGRVKRCPLIWPAAVLAAALIALARAGVCAEAPPVDQIKSAIAQADQLNKTGQYQKAFDLLGPVWQSVEEAVAAPGFVPQAEFSRQRLALHQELTKATLGYANQVSARGLYDQAISGIDWLLSQGQGLGTNFEARKARAELLEGKGDLNGALAEWGVIQSKAPSGLDEYNLAVSNISRLQATISSAAAAQTPVQAQPMPGAGTPVPPNAPGQTPQPITVSAEKALESGKELIESAPEKIKNVDYENVLDRTLAVVKSDTFITYAGGLVAIILGWWVIWFYITKLLAKVGNIRASMWLPRVKKYGFVAFVGFLASNVSFEKKEKTKRNLCPNCSKPVDDVESYASLNFYVCPFCNESIKPIFSLNDYIDHLTSNIQRISGTGRGGNGSDNPLERDAMAKLVRCIMTKAARERSTDLHVESGVDGVSVRARRDGMLGEFLKFSRPVGTPMLNALMIQAQLDITQHMVPQDGKFSIWVDGADIDIRLNSAPGPYGPNITMRLLDRRRITVDSTQLGLEGRSLELFERSIRHAHGLILVTGPSGSGKSTTLYVALNTLNNGDRSIITIEDPIEYQLPGLKQMQVNVAQHFTFATGLRSILRQDPDVIMVGEIRDKETADIALDAAITGHLVFTTLHTIDSSSAITRLRDLGIEPRRYAEALDLVLAQRLIRLNCPECKKSYKPQPKEFEQAGIAPSRDQLFYKGAGCENCNETGFFGRTGIFEALDPTGPIKEILETNVSSPVIRELARKSGMKTLREEGVLRVLQGKTTMDEILRVTS